MEKNTDSERKYMITAREILPTAKEALTPLIKIAIMFSAAKKWSALDKTRNSARYFWRNLSLEKQLKGPTGSCVQAMMSRIRFWRMDSYLSASRAY